MTPPLSVQIFQKYGELHKKHPHYRKGQTLWSVCYEVKVGIAEALEAMFPTIFYSDEDFDAASKWIHETLGN